MADPKRVLVWNIGWVIVKTLAVNASQKRDAAIANTYRDKFVISLDFEIITPGSEHAQKANMAHAFHDLEFDCWSTKSAVLFSDFS